MKAFFPQKSPLRAATRRLTGNAQPLNRHTVTGQDLGINQLADGLPDRDPTATGIHRLRDSIEYQMGIKRMLLPLC